MNEKYHFVVNTEDYDEAIERAKEERDTIISELIKRNQNSFILEMIIPIKYHERIDEYEEKTVGVYEVGIDELFDDMTDCIEYFSYLIRDLQEEIEKCKRSKKNDKRRIIEYCRRN